MSSKASDSKNRIPTKGDTKKEDRIRELLKEAQHLDFVEHHPDIAFSSNTDILGNTLSGTDIVTEPHDSLDGHFGDSESDSQQDSMTNMTKMTSIYLSRNFDTLYQRIYEPNTKIYGMSYEAVKKLTMYIGLSNALKGNMIEDFFHHDMRIPALVCLQPGGGKNMIKRALMLNEVPDKTDFVQPTSFHSEHFVGKYTWDKEKKDVIDHKGYLQDDVVIIDEAKTLLRDPKYEEARKYIRTALDPIGSNEIVKGTSDVPEKFRKHFIPNCVVVTFCQPDEYPDELATSGDLRRNIIAYFPISHDEKLQIVGHKKRAGRPNKMRYIERRKEWIAILDTLMNKTFRWDLSEVKEDITRIGEDFYRYAKYRGPLAAAMAEDAYFDAMLHLTRFTLIRAAVEGLEKPMKRHLDAAYDDFWIFYQQFLDFSTQLLKGKFIQVENRKIRTADLDKIHEAILWLADQNALSPILTTIGPNELLGWMSDEKGWGGTKGGNSGSYRIYKTMKKFGYIEYKKEGVGGTAKIWIREDKIPYHWKEEIRGTLKRDANDY